MGRAIEVTRRDHTAAELREVAGKTADGAEMRRLLAIVQVLEGRSRSEAAEQCDSPKKGRSSLRLGTLHLPRGMFGVQFKPDVSIRARHSVT